MRTLETTFFPLEDHPELGVGLGVFLGSADDPALAGLTEGERVALVEPNELEAEGVVRRVVAHGRPFWYAEISSREAIRVIDVGPMPDPASTSAQTSG